MRIVASNSEEHLLHNEAVTELTVALRELTANLLRVCRGGGKPDKIFAGLERCLEAMQDHRDIIGRDPPEPLLKRILDFEKINDRPAESGDVSWLRAREAERLTIRASLQIVASSLIGQPLQLGRAEQDLADALAAYRLEHRASSQGKPIEL